MKTVCIWLAFLMMVGSLSVAKCANLKKIEKNKEYKSKMQHYDL